MVSRSQAPRTFRAFNNASYRRLWLATFLSMMSRSMQLTLLFWLVLELTNSPGRVAMVAFWGSLPMLLLGIVGGILADRFNRQRLITLTLILSWIVTLAMTVTLYVGLVEYWHAYIVAFLVGMAFPLEMPSRRSIIHELLGNTELTNGIALDTLGMSASKMLGPAVAGVLIVLIDIQGGYLVVTVSYTIAVLLMVSLRVSSTEQDTYSHSSILRNVWDGIKYVRGHSTILSVVMITFIFNILLFSYVPMVPVIARDVLKVGPALVGVLMAADGVGALLGAVLVASSPRITHHGRIFLVGSLVALLFLLLFSLSSWYALSFPLLFLLGMGTAGFSTMQSTIVILVAKPDLRGMGLGVIGLAIGAGPLGALFVAGVSTAVSPAFSLGLNASLGIVAVGLIALLMPSLRQRILPPEKPLS